MKDVRGDSQIQTFDPPSTKIHIKRQIENVHGWAIKEFQDEVVMILDGKDESYVIATLGPQVLDDCVDAWPNSPGGFPTGLLTFQVTDTDGELAYDSKGDSTFKVHPDWLP